MRLPLNALRTFEAVASRLSFSAGAAALNVSAAAVSSQVRALEARIGQPLFSREGRRVALTQAGRLLLPGVQRGFRELEQAVGRLLNEQQEGVLNVSMLSSFLQKWLLPRLPEFYATHPAIDLRINADVAPIDFAETDFHAAIRFGRGVWPGLEAVKLLDDWTLPVCSRALLEVHGALTAPDEIERYPLLHSRDEPWGAWLSSIGGHAGERRGPVFDDSISIVLAAEQGLGLALARWSLVAAELASGRLVRPLPIAVRSEFAYYFVAPAHYFSMPKVSEFRAWLEDCCRAFPAPDGE
jgi:LysR family transcriptional regulator, glycine cleavage system transcriptional activator